MTGVIGGSGFIGTNLCARLAARGTPFCIIDKRPSPFYPDCTRIADVRDLPALTEALRDVDTIYNLAAEHRDDVRPRALYDEVNVEGARNVCAAATRRGIRRLVFTSSVAVYGKAPAGTDESGRVLPVNDYGRTKLLAEGLYHAWSAGNPGATLVVVRPTVVFGPRNRGNLYGLFRQLATHKFVMVGSGRNEKSIAFVSNVAAFLEHVSHLEPGAHLFNYVDEPAFSMNSLVLLVKNHLALGAHVRLRLPFALGYLGGLAFDVLGTMTGRRFAVSAGRVRKFCATTRFRASRLVMTGFVPPVSLEQGLAETLDFEFGGRERDKEGPGALFDTE